MPKTNELPVELDFENFINFMEFTTNQIKLCGRLDVAVITQLRQQQHIVKHALRIAEHTITPRDIMMGGW